MTIDQAIKLLEDIGPYRGTLSGEDLESIKLGIQGLKWVKAERTGYELYAPDLLPGETEE